MPAVSHQADSVIGIYKCLCDLNRLRILNLLRVEPQCVCHIEQVLGIGSVRTSQQLAYLRRHGMVEVATRGTWRIYSLPAKPSRELVANLACLQDCVFDTKVFRTDLAVLKRIRGKACGPQAP
ncbi:MAG: helix-turn-helix transcriptional regulator [Verrucomicrobia bacterium]|nr:helix-turn-helix transcriptional regulator [Verrucomicrobiota bacterium]